MKPGIFRTARLAIAIAVLILQASACGRETTDAVIIADGATVKWKGAIEEPTDLRAGFDGEIAPWKEGAIIIFRSDGAYLGHTGAAGRAYRIVGEELDPVGSVDLEKSDDDLALEFGVEEPQ